MRMRSVSCRIASDRGDVLQHYTICGFPPSDTTSPLCQYGGTRLIQRQEWQDRAAVPG